MSRVTPWRLLVSAGHVADLIEGSFGNDELRGGSGNDELRGNQESDILIGGADFDAMFGGGSSTGGYPDIDVCYLDGEPDVSTGGCELIAS